MFGYKKNELIGQNVNDLFPDIFSEKSPHGENLVSALSGTVIVAETEELTGTKKDGSSFPIELSLSPFSTMKGEFYTAFVRDFSEKKKIETLLTNRRVALELSNKELEEFAYVTSHDLQEPVRVMLNYTQMLERNLKEKLEEKDKEYIDFVVDAGRRMQRLILDLLSYSRLTQKSGAKELEDIDLNETLRTIAISLGIVVEESKTELIIPDMPKIKGSYTHISQLFQNLISNAIKYKQKEKAPIVELSWSENSSHWLFKIADNGIGINKKYFDRIFVIFQRLHNKQEYSGTGIGLALCKKIVDQHGGEISLSSEENEGSCFHFSIKKNLS
jgi:PAS domain S-box-containing protein